MGYTKFIEHYMIEFKDEISYLNCRKEYLELEYLGLVNKDVSFLKFIQLGVSHKYEWHVEKISDTTTDNNIFSSIYSATTTANYPTASQWDIANTNSSTYSSYALNEYQTSFISPDDLPITPTKIKKKKESPPDDPIEDRFSILDL